MALDTLILGPFVFTDFAVPDNLPGGGRQQLHIHKMPGGARVIDAMGPDDEDRQWSGIFWGSDALSKALTLDAMRRAGNELPYSNGAEARTVVIAAFGWHIEKFNCIHYQITVTPSDTGGGGSIGVSSIDSMILGDLTSALSLLQ